MWLIRIQNKYLSVSDIKYNLVSYGAKIDWIGIRFSRITIFKYLNLWSYKNKRSYWKYKKSVLCMKGMSGGSVSI